MPKFVTDETLQGWFAYHKPETQLIADVHDEIRKSCHVLAVFFNDVLPEGPDKTVALRAVREAMYHANACIAVAQRVYQPDVQIAMKKDPE